MDLTRRDLGLSVFGLTLAGDVGAIPRESVPLGPALRNDPLLYVAPELRSAARQMLSAPSAEFSPSTLPQIQQQTKNTMFATTEFLPDVPVQTHTIPIRSGIDPVRAYVINAKEDKGRPAIIYMHGGGFVAGTARGQVTRFQTFAAALDCTVVSVEYQLAPAARYSTAIEQNYGVLRWVFRQSDQLGVDPRRIAVMGESAGGAHAATLAFTARDRGEVPVLFQLLVYPALDDRTGSTRSLPSHLGAIGWSANSHRFAWRNYLGMEPGQPEVPALAVPARRADLSGLPPAWIGVGGIDLLAPEALDYARRLTEAAVPTELCLVPGAYHGFDKVPGDIPLVVNFNQAKLNALRRAFDHAQI